MPTNENHPQGGPLPIWDPGLWTRMLANATSLASRYATAAHEANLDVMADPFGRSRAYLTSFNNSGDICGGLIIDGSATANCYRVQLTRQKTPIWATPLLSTGQSALGATQINTYPPATFVFVYLPAEANHGYIIGALPWGGVYGNSVHDAISLTSRKRVDDCHKRYYSMEDGGGVINWSAHQPIDATHAGEWGAITSTGLKVTLDDFMVQMAVNEFTGVFGFYHDQLLRISGMGLQCWTGGSERDALVDEGEYNDYQGYTPYSWENFGVLEPGTDMVNEYTAANFLCPAQQPYYAHWENKEKFQAPFHRTQEYYGYLGQGKKTIVCGPPKDKPKIWTLEPGKGNTPEKPFEGTVANTNAEKQDCSAGPQQQTTYEEKNPVGFHEDNIAVDGRRFIASAKGITLAKRMLIPVPTRIRKGEDGTGDRGDAGYRPAGLDALGNGPEHKITGDLKTDAGKYANIQRAAGILDLHAYLFNYAGLHPFHWHYKDFKTWEQQELKHAEYNHHIPQYSELVSQMYLPEPTIDKGLRKIEVDHRYKEQNFFETESFISLLEDGAVVIGDGYGGEIRMCGGVITISAPGDIWMKPGRNAQIWAGKDCIVRAKKNVDISTSDKDVRIKSEGNVMVLAGNNENGKSGGVLIESRGKQIEYDFEEVGEEVKFGGVVLRAPKSNVVAHAKDVYLRCGGNYSDGLEKGTITLDAGTGLSDIVTKSTSIHNYVEDGGEVSYYYGFAREGEPQIAHYFSKDTILLSGFLYITDYLFGGKGVVADGFGYFNGPLVADTQVVFPCVDDCENELKKAKGTLDAYVKEILPNMAKTYHDGYLDTIFYANKRAGNDETVKKMGFSFRKDKEYMPASAELVVFEDRWQQMARESGQSLGKWEEKAVVTNGKETYPFPGKERFTQSGVFKMQSFKLIENNGGKLRDKKRNSGSGGLASEYADPAFGTTKPGTLKNDYTIIGD